MYSLDEETNDEEELEKLDQDYSRPASPPSGIQDLISEDHPTGDTDADFQDWYDKGRSVAFGADDPGDRGVKAYRPTPDAPKNGPVKIVKPKKRA